MTKAIPIPTAVMFAPFVQRLARIALCEYPRYKVELRRGDGVWVVMEFERKLNDWAIVRVLQCLNQLDAQVTMEQLCYGYYN